MKIWKTLLIEDEEPAIERLARMLSVYDDFNINGYATNGIDGVALIDSLQPDLVFLDIEMPGLNGFEVLSRIKHQPKVIFTTAYDQYAIKAFEENTIDYLLKPVVEDRLEKTIKKLRQTHTQSVEAIAMASNLVRFDAQEKLKTLTVKAGNRILLIRLEEIVIIEAEDKFVFLNLKDGRRHLTDFTLTELIAQLPKEFQRIHRGSIINTEHIKEIRKAINGTLVFIMKHADQRRLSSSRQYQNMLKQYLHL